MSLVLINLQSNQQINLDNHNPFIIGRGNVDGCFDKRVSRNHGRITCTPDGKIRLVALHCNPCFFTRNGIPPVLQLNKDEEETLSEGDCLGLLPNAFWFQIKSNKKIKIKEEAKETNSTNTEINNDSILNDKLPENVKPANNTVIFENVNCMLSKDKDSSNPAPVPRLYKEIVPDSASTSKSFGTPEFEKTRRLPLWMYEIDESVQPSKSSNKHKLMNSDNTQNKKQEIGSEIKKEVNIKSEVETQVENEALAVDTASPSELNNAEGWNLVSSPPCGSNNTSQVQGESSKVNSHKEGYESDVNNKAETPSKRSLCEYEGNCYRKNPQHKIEFCHPGDTDYTPYEERPICQYGAACYRMNKRHRVEFRHSVPGSGLCNISSSSSCSHTSLASSPLPAKRRRAKVKKQKSDYEDDDEYDVDDPFINDASSDEYVPSEWDTEEEELENFDTSNEDER